MTDPRIGIEMFRRSTKWHPTIEILDWEKWFLVYRDYGRVSLAEQMNIIDEVIDDLECDERVEDIVADEEVKNMNHMMDDVMNDLEVKSHNTQDAMRELDEFRTRLPTDIQTIMELVKKYNYSARAATSILGLHTKDNTYHEAQWLAIKKLQSFLDMHSINTHKSCIKK